MLRKHQREWEISTFGSESCGGDINMAIYGNFYANNQTQKGIYLLGSLANTIRQNDNDRVLIVTECLNNECPMIKITQMRYGIKINAWISAADRSRRRNEADDYNNYYQNHDRSCMKMDDIPYHNSSFTGKDDNNNCSIRK